MPTSKDTSKHISKDEKNCGSLQFEIPAVRGKEGNHETVRQLFDFFHK